MLIGRLHRIAVVAIGLAAGSAAAACPGATEPPRRVAAVAAPFVLVLDDGSEVRLSGVLWPRAGGDLGSSRALADLVIGRSVRLAVAGTDRHGRTMARAERTDGSDLSVALVEAGEAVAGGLPRLTACDRDLVAAESRARAARRGGWGDGRLAVDDAGDRGLEASAGRFAVVEGRVVSVGRAGRVHYLNFGGPWRLDFTVTIAESDGAVLAARGSAPAALAGVTVRVRGWLDAREGGFLRLPGPEEFERVGGFGPAGEGG